MVQKLHTPPRPARTPPHTQPPPPNIKPHLTHANYVDLALLSRVIAPPSGTQKPAAASVDNGCCGGLKLYAPRAGCLTHPAR